jgi:tRNA threonylcarbamoyladenosine biosynthesis protein TsaB
VFEEGVCLAQRVEVMQRGQAARLPALVAEVLGAAGGRAVGLVAVTVGPGSFTGLRAALGFAHGLAAGWGCPIVGVGVAEALVDGLEVTGRAVWVALHSRPGRVFLVRDGVAGSFALDALPAPEGRPVLLGTAAGEVLARLGGAADVVGDGVMEPRQIAAVGLRRHRGGLPPLAALPMYVDAPEATPSV